MTQATKREVELGEKTFSEEFARKWYRWGRIQILDSRYSNFNSTVFSLTWTFGQSQFLQSFLDRNKPRKFEVRFFLGFLKNSLLDQAMVDSYPVQVVWWLRIARSVRVDLPSSFWCGRAGWMAKIVSWGETSHHHMMSQFHLWLPGSWRENQRGLDFCLFFFGVRMSLRRRDVASSALVG